MSLPLVSIVIPCYNGARYLAPAVESALDQTHPRCEVLVVDDGSTDESVAIAERYAPRVRLLRGDHAGACAARNKGLSAATGTFVQFLDADDLLAPNKIERQLEVAAREPGVTVLCQATFIDDTGGSLPTAAPYPPLAPADDAFVYFLSYGYQTSLPLHTRASLQRVGGFREELKRAQEADLHLRLAAVGTRVTVLPDRLVSLRRHDGPRVTRQSLAADYFLSHVLVPLAEWLESEGEATVERRRALASKIHMQSVYAYRSGARDAAKIGFATARALAAHYDYEERSWVKGLTRLTGPMNTERLLGTARWLRG